MNKNTNYIAEIALIIWSFTKSPIFAFFLLMYFIYISEERKKDVAKSIIPDNNKDLTTEDISRIAETERKRSMTEDDLSDPLVMGGASSLEVYKEFIIDNYDNRFYRVMAPSGQYLEKIYMSLEEAKLEVDAASAVLPVQKSKERKLYNIRYVR